MKRVSRRSTPAHPAGLTLVEVLMSMLVTGIGVLSSHRALAPFICAGRAGDQSLTNGTILRYNAESLFDAMTRPISSTSIPFGSPTCNYAVGQYVLAPTNAGSGK